MKKNNEKPLREKSKSLKKTKSPDRNGKKTLRTEKRSFDDRKDHFENHGSEIKPRLKKDFNEKSDSKTSRYGKDRSERRDDYKTKSKPRFKKDFNEKPDSKTSRYGKDRSERRDDYKTESKPRFKNDFNEKPDSKTSRYGKDRSERRDDYKTESKPRFKRDFNEKSDSKTSRFRKDRTEKQDDYKAEWKPRFKRDNADKPDRRDSRFKKDRNEKQFGYDSESRSRNKKTFEKRSGKFSENPGQKEDGRDHFSTKNNDFHKKDKYYKEKKSREEKSGKSKRPRISKEKNYTGRAHVYKHTEILVVDNSKKSDYKRKMAAEGVRLNRFIANAGICSRREADDLIESGVISINGEIITQLGTKVLPGDEVKYNDQLLFGEKLQYVLLNKPKGYITTTDDPQERKTVMMLIKNACKERVYPVGRLDKNTTGLLLFTNDGDMAKKLTHPKHMIEKIYHVELNKNLAKSDMEKIADGIELDDGFIKIDAIAYEDSKNEIGIEIHSGKNRIVRRIFESLGYEVVKLDRVVFAGLTKKDLPRGKFRFLSPEEVNILRRLR